MFKAIQTSVSGLIASSVRLNVAASNIANAHVKSTPTGRDPNGRIFEAAYTPLRVEQAPTGSGGVRATIVSVSPASLSIFDPSSPLANSQGNVNIPNVSLPAEFAELNRASHAYKANAKVLKTLDDTFKTLLKI
jgi:flagellar basal-body rod protein FlgC